MFCPRCGVQSDEARAACWNCFAQLRTVAEVKADVKAAKKAGAKPEKADPKKGKKGAPVEEPIAEPVPVTVSVMEEAAPMAVAAAMEINVVPTEVSSAPAEPIATPFNFSEDPDPAEESALDIPLEPMFLGGVSLGDEPEAAPIASTDDDIGFLSSAPLTDITLPDIPAEDDAVPNDARVMDLDAPVADSPYVIPGLADDDDSQEFSNTMPDFGPTAFDLDSDEPDKKPDKA